MTDWNEIFYYDETSPSCLRWKISIGSGRYQKIFKVVKGQSAGWKSQGYYSVKYNKKSHLVHRVIYEMFYGDNENTPIDHINGDSLDNRISNLRLADGNLNARNIKQLSTNTSGVCGVVYAVAIDKRKDNWYYSPSWRAQWHDLNGKRKLKSFSVNKYGYEKAFQLACECRAKMIEELNAQGAGYTARHGKEF